MQSQSINSVWSVSLGKPVFCVSSSRDGGQIAVGTSDACLVLDALVGKQIFHTEKDGGPVTAVAFAKPGQLLVGAQSTLRLWDVQDARVLATLELGNKAEGSTDDEGAVLLAAQPTGELFGVVAEHGRRVYIVGGDLRVHSELEVQPNCGSLSELSWLSDSAVLATSSGGIQAWVHTEERCKPSLVLGKSIGLIAARASPDHSTLAAGSRDGVVYLWSLSKGDAKQGADALAADLRSTLKDYSDEVQLLRWDGSGRYLATADGSDATIWDIPKLFEEPVQSTICSGHDHDSRILCAAFQADGPVLATGGSDGRVLFFNSALFQAGQVCQPCAAASWKPAGEGVSCIAWLPGGQLVAGTRDGNIVGCQLQSSAYEEGPSSPISDRVERSTSEPQEVGPSGGMARSDVPDASMNGFSSKKSFPKGAARPLKATTETTSKLASLPDGPCSSSAVRLNRPRPTSVQRDTPSSSLSMERNSSLPGRSMTNAAEKFRSDSGRAGETSQGLNEATRSMSLQDAQGLGRRTTSLERQQLSPSLMQHIQRVQQKSISSTRQREPAGWGMGSPSAATASSSQMQFMGPSGVMPFNPAAAQGQMPQGFMVFPNQAAAMGPQQMMPSYGFPPAMAHLPMMPHGSNPQGLVGGKPMPGMQPFYMPMGAPAMPQQQWPMVHGQMVQTPWMGHYFMPAGQHAIPPEHLNIISAGRSSSAPDGPLAFNWAAHPVQVSEPASAASGAPQDSREELAKNAISLPSSLSRDWRASRASPKNGEYPQHGAQPPSEPGAQQTGAPKRKGSMSSERDVMSGSGSKDSKELKERDSQESQTSGVERTWTPPSDSLRPSHPQESTTVEEDAEHISDASTPVLTVYVGNLPPTVDEVALMVPFSYYGNITNIQVIRDKNSLQSRGFAFVSYSQPLFAASAIQHMNGRILYGSFRGRALKVGPSNRVI